MKQIFQTGDQKTFSRKVRNADVAYFDTAKKEKGGGLVHPVYGTFALARDAEWVCRLFVLDMKEDDEEGIGTMVSVEHNSPAFVGETVDFLAKVETIRGNEIICSYQAKAGNRLIARGKQGQKILKKEKIQKIFHLLKEEKND